ncbi:MAG: FeoB small GTPase domain-containing protein [Bacteroidales bacterium]
MSKINYTLALAGNPNTGKTTIFNMLTGLNQHTGNWPGKTVTKSEGYYSFNSERFCLVDLPGTYSLLSQSQDEEIARDYILFNNPSLVIVVVDATALERNLNLVLQILQINSKVIVCLNLLDEAKRKGIQVDHNKLSLDLGVPVVPTIAAKNIGKDKLLDVIYQACNQEIEFNPKKLLYPYDLQKDIDRISKRLRILFPDIQNAEWLALRLIDGDEKVKQVLQKANYEFSR